jgi:hypothetical protein
MSDLSRLLDDVYGTGGEDPPAEPDWSSDAALDTVFADWVPGEPAEAEAVTENSFLDSDTFGAAVGLVPDIDVPPIAEPERPTLLDLPAWVPSDDDILPARKRLRLSLRR